MDIDEMSEYEIVAYLLAKSRAVPHPYNRILRIHLPDYIEQAHEAMEADA